jgi:hypothetical protein
MSDVGRRIILFGILRPTQDHSERSIHVNIVRLA